jgi:hypothetical protein
LLRASVAAAIAVAGCGRAATSGRSRPTAEIGEGGKQLTAKSDGNWCSLIQVLARPDAYHGREIVVEGYLEVKFEGTAIYLSREDAEYNLTRNGFWVSLRDSPLEATVWEIARQFHGQYVRIEGIFDAEDCGFHDDWAGSFDKITMISTKGFPARRMEASGDVRESHGTPKCKDVTGQPQ